jgi:hypothetical protein
VSSLALGKGSVTVTWRRDGDFSLPSVKRHSANSLPSARQKVLGKEAVADVQFAERSLPSVTLDKGSVTVTWRRDGDFSLPSVKRHSANSLSSARQKVLGKEAVADIQFAERSLPSVTLGKAFAECKIAFVECLRHSAGKGAVSGSERTDHKKFLVSKPLRVQNTIAEMPLH